MFAVQGCNHVHILILTQIVIRRISSSIDFWANINLHTKEIQTTRKSFVIPHNTIFNK